MSEQTAASIVRRNGAYLIVINDPFDDMGVWEQADAAASLQVAKRIAKLGAKQTGFTHLRWDGLTLVGRLTEHE